MSDEAETEVGPWPVATIAIASLVLLVFALEHLAGVEEPDKTTYAVLRCGAVEPAAVFVRGELFRLITAAFVHVPFGQGALALPHVVLNGWALIQLASIVESVYGRTRLLVVYLLSAIGCSLASAWFSGAVSAGASGAIFGLLGFLLAASRLHAQPVRELFKRAFGRQLLFWTVLWVVVGMTGLLRIDQAGHLGGLATGLLLGVLIRSTDRPGPFLAGVLLTLGLATAGSFFLVAVKGGDSAELVSTLEKLSVASADGEAAVASEAYSQVFSGHERKIERIVGRSGPSALALVAGALAQGKKDEAKRIALETALLVKPPFDGSLRAVGRLIDGNRDEALPELDRFSKDASADARQMLALFLEHQGWSGSALRLLDQLYAEHPKDATHVNALAWVLLTAKDERFREPKRGLELARRAAELERDSPAVLDTLAEAELQSGDLVQALVHEEKAVELARRMGDEKLDKELAPRLERLRALMKSR